VSVLAPVVSVLAPVVSVLAPPALELEELAPLAPVGPLVPVAGVAIAGLLEATAVFPDGGVISGAGSVPSATPPLPLEPQPLAATVTIAVAHNTTMRARARTAQPPSAAILRPQRGQSFRSFWQC